MKNYQRHTLTTLVMLLMTLPLCAQRISGIVTDQEGTAIENARLTEVDADHRILSGAETDANGCFTMKLRKAGSSRIRINAEGYVMLTQRSRTGQNQCFVMSRKKASRLSTIQKQQKGRERNYVLTEALLCGHKANGNEVPWLVMVEMLGDSTYVLRLPVHATSTSAIYPEGRGIVFLDWGDGQMLASYNGEDTRPTKGAPREYKTWRDVLNYEEMSCYMLRDYGDRMGEMEELYFYPPFLLTQGEIDQLISHADHLARLLIDSERGDNGWFMYPRKDFGKQLLKEVTKLKRKAAKKARK